MRFRAAFIVLAVVGLAGAAVYMRRKREVGPSPVQLGLEDGAEQALAAGDAAFVALQSAAAALRRGFEIGS